LHRGYIKLWRCIEDNPDYFRDKFTDVSAWIDLLLIANHKNGNIKKRGIRLEIERGEVAWSELQLASRWKWSRGKVRRFLQYLVQQKMIAMVQQNNKITTKFKIINYDLYQSNDTTEKILNDTTDSTTNGHQTDIKRYKNKNDKNVKNEKNKEYKLKPFRSANDETWLSELSANPAYKGIDIHDQLHRCTEWFRCKNIQVSRQRFLNWLNRTDRKITHNPKSTITSWADKPDIP
jgi:hypothetical protein